MGNERFEATIAISRFYITYFDMSTHLETILWIIGGACAVLAYFLYPITPSSEIDSLTKSPKPAFHASRLTNTTFLVKEYNDIYSEHPHIYAKVVPEANTILLIDTGCGGASTDNEIVIKSLKEFIEVVQVDDNNGKPLNKGGRMGYVVALTHCHYDHICTYSHIVYAAASCHDSLNLCWLLGVSGGRRFVSHSFHVPTPVVTEGRPVAKIGPSLHQVILPVS